MTNEERNIAIADMRRMKNEYMNGRKIDEVAERKCKSFDMAIKALEQTTWIPVSERLPEVGKKVLVTSYGRVCYAVMISTDGNSGYPIFRLQDSLKEKTVCETIAHSDMTSSRIVAWMPLPDPYKGE